MKFIITAMILFAIHSGAAFCQADSTKLLNQVKNKLLAHLSTASAILSDPVYDPLHSHTTFRELIKEYAETSTLTIVNNKEPGKKIKVVTTVKNQAGKALPGALVYLYQTDSRGWYAADAPHVLVNEGDYRHARLFGYVKTDKNGQFELQTVKPSGYPQSDLPAHIHVQVMKEGYRVLQIEFLFQDDERLKGEVLNRAIVDGGIIAKPELTELPFSQKFSYALTIKSNN
jgi:protocatechuate 3,4-dioxygenase beta subunit